MTRTSSDFASAASALDPWAALQRASSGGAAYADLFVESCTRSLVAIQGGEIVRASAGEERGMAIRALIGGGRTRFASSTAIDRTILDGLARDLGSDRASAIPLEPAATLNFGSVRSEAAPIEAKIALARAAERAARSVSPEVKEVSVSVRGELRRTILFGSDGRSVDRTSARSIAAIEVIASDGSVSQSALEAAGGTGELDQVSLEVVEAIALLAARRAVTMVHAEPAPSGEMAVVLAAEAGGTFVHEAVGHSLETDLVLKGLSALGERMGETVASRLVTVADDATIPGKNGSFAADDEGTPAERTVLIDRGVLVGLLHDERTARAMGARSTGKGRRESFRYRPIVRMSNTMIAPGSDDPQAIIRATDRGLYVVRMGGGEVDTVTGQFVFEVNEAYLIENGAIGRPVRGATLAGDCQEVLLAIDRVGSDLGFGIGTCEKDGQSVPITDAEPTIRIPSLIVGGP
jgi:TldD protein